LEKRLALTWRAMKQGFEQVNRRKNIPLERGERLS